MELNNGETYSYTLSSSISDFGATNMSGISKKKIKTSISSKLTSTFRASATKQQSKMKQRKTFSFKSKLKCKIFEKKSKLAEISHLSDSCFKEPKLIDSLSASLFDSFKANSKETVVSTLYKIMDKSLGWLKIKSTKNSKKYTKSSFLYSSPMSMASLNPKRIKTKKSSKIPLVRYINDKISKQTKNKTAFNLNYSTPKANSKRFAANESSYTRSCLFSAPSMASSFNESMQQAKFHSTPQSLYKKQFSPILYATSIISSESVSDSTFSSLLSTSSQLKSTPISSCAENKSILSFTPNCSRRRLSFGVTSSPKSLDFSEHESNCDYQPQVSVEKIDHAKQQRLIDHINNIKKNAKLSYELRDLKSASYYNDKNKFYDENGDQGNANKKSMLNKRKKLQKIFQIKLRKQLKEIKKWQNGVKTGFDANNNDLSVSAKSGSDCQHGYYTNSNESSFSSNEYPRFVSNTNYYYSNVNSLNKATVYCQCDCNANNNNFNYMENVDNYFNFNCN